MSEPGPPSSETELRVQLAEARTDTKFAEMLGEVRIGFAKMDGRFGEIEARMGGLERSTSGIKATVIGTGIAVVALVIAVMTYGQTWFGIGVSTRDVVKAAVTEYRQQQDSAKRTLIAPPHLPALAQACVQWPRNCLQPPAPWPLWRQVRSRSPWRSAGQCRPDAKALRGRSQGALSVTLSIRVARISSVQSNRAAAHSGMPAVLTGHQLAADLRSGRRAMGSTRAPAFRPASSKPGSRPPSPPRAKARKLASSSRALSARPSLAVACRGCGPGWQIMALQGPATHFRARAPAWLRGVDRPLREAWHFASRTRKPAG